MWIRRTKEKKRLRSVPATTSRTRMDSLSEVFNHHGLTVGIVGEEEEIPFRLLCEALKEWAGQQAKRVAIKVYCRLI
jgi:hypothetical protein